MKEKSFLGKNGEVGWWSEEKDIEHGILILWQTCGFLLNEIADVHRTFARLWACLAALALVNTVLWGVLVWT